MIVQAGQTIYVKYTGGPTGYVHFYLALIQYGPPSELEVAQKHNGMLRSRVSELEV